MRPFLAAMLLIACAPFARAAAVSEYRLPGFQTAALDQDLPAVDAVLAGDDTLWFLGKQNLWSWSLASGRLARVSLPKQGEWQKLYFDGFSVYAAGTKALFQVQVAQKRYFSYELPLAGAGDALGFAGEGDELWLLHGRALMKLDRYGKALTPKLPGAPLQKDDVVALDPERETLWIARGKQLLRLTPGADAKLMITAKNPLIGLAVAAGQVIVHTEHSVLRLDARTAKTLKSIPVQGSRKLTAMAIGKDKHAYAFDDRTLEFFDLKAKTEHSYRLPLDSDERIDSIAASGDTAAVLVGGRPHAFRLSSPN